MVSRFIDILIGMYNCNSYIVGWPSICVGQGCPCLTELRHIDDTLPDPQLCYFLLEASVQPVTESDLLGHLGLEPRACP